MTWLAASACRVAREIKGLTSQEVRSVREITQGNQPVLPYLGQGRRGQVITIRSGTA